MCSSPSRPGSGPAPARPRLLPGAGPIQMAGLPLKFTETPGEIRSPPPRLGEHTDAVLHRLGYGAEKIQDFAERGVIGLDTSDEAAAGD